MSDRGSSAVRAAPSRGITSRHFRVLNLFMLASIIGEWLLCYSVGGVELAKVMVGSSTVLYVLLLVLAPPLNRWLRPELPVEKKGARLVGVVAYGGVSLALVLWTLSPLFG